MAQTLEAIKGGGGSVKVGSTGTISALMSRELQSVKYASPNPETSAEKSPQPADLVASEAATPKRLKPKVSADEASSSGSNGNINHKNPEITRKTKHHTSKSQIPILVSDNISTDGTPIRAKPNKKGSYIVEVVDVKCGSPDRAWASPITNRLKKLGFSKLSENTPPN